MGKFQGRIGILSIHNVLCRNLQLFSKNYAPGVPRLSAF